MGSEGSRYRERECQSSWAGDRCHEGHQPAHGQVGSALAGGPGAGRNEPGDRICQHRRGPGSVLSCSSPALTRRAALHATRRSCDLVRPSSVAVASRLVHCKSTRLASGCPPRTRSARRKWLLTNVQAKQGVRHGHLSFPRASSSRTNQGARVRVPIAPRSVTSCQVRAVLARVLPRPAHSISRAVSTRA